jgi:ABC-type transport system substrate-binding protein
VRRPLVASLLAAALLFGVACSGGSSSSSSGSSASGAAAPVSGGTLRLGIERPASLDPALANPGAQGELVMADLLFDGLTTVPAGATEPEPAIASAWTPSADLKTWTFTLRPDAKFSNGRAITSADVKYTLERVAKRGEGSLASLRLEPITGWTDYVAGTSPEIVGIKASAPASVEIDLTTPVAAVPELLSAPVYGIVPKEAVEAASPAFASAPVGSGPFQFARADGAVLVLQKAAGSSAYLDEVDVHTYDDADKAYADFASGALDWSPVPTAKVADAIGRYGSGAFRPFHAEVFYAFNLLDPALADVHFRQAIVKAIDRAAIVKAVYPDAASTLNGLIADGVPGHLDDACGAPCAYDVAAAKALVAQAFPDGAVPTVHLDYATSPTADAVAVAISTALTAAGIPNDTRPKAAADYDSFATSGQESLFQFGWVGLYPDADAYLVPLFAGGSRDNATGLSDPGVDQLLVAARGTADRTARIAAFQKAEAAILATFPIVPIGQLLTKVVVADKVHDLSLNVGGTFAADRVWLAP